MPIELPKGVKDFLPELAGRLSSVESDLLKTFESWGYRKVITPYLEYLDVLALAEPEFLDQMFKFEDRVSGKVLALRPDITAQIARLSASHLKDRPKPFRLYYSGSILHYGEKDKGGRREIHQSGLELIGLEQPEADGEVIAVAIESLKSTGLSDFKIDVGQVEFFRGVMEMLNLPGELREEVETAVAIKDRSGIEALLPSLALKDKEADLLLALPTLFGGREVLDRAKTLSVGPRAGKALDNLSQVLDTLESNELIDYITVDLGEIRGLDYYTGVIFEGFVAGHGEEVCGGGRYDNLLGRYGFETAATGFAINVESLLDALEKQGKTYDLKSADFLIVNLAGENDRALKIARYLRSKGFNVARGIAKRELSEFTILAKSELIDKLVIVGDKDIADNEFWIQELKDGGKESYSLEDLFDDKLDAILERI